MSPLRVAILAISLIHAAALHADEPAVELPKEGAWVRYHVVHKPEGGSEVTYDATVKFLGRKDHDGTRCRWVEVVEQQPGGTAKVGQFLVPERALLESTHPLDETVVANRREGDGEILPLRLDIVTRGDGGAYLLFLPATRKNAKPVQETQSVDYQRGRLLIPGGQQGEFRVIYEAMTVKEIRNWIYDYKIWLDPKLPAGFARGHFSGRYERDGVINRKWTFDFYLEDFGFDAKSTFPN